ncbi:MAG: hypothetical protein V3T14_12735 [Myxococcota bacterium]
MSRGVPLVAALLLACGAPMRLDDVPGDPIAFVRQDAGSISDLAEFLKAVDLVGPEEVGRPVPRSRVTISLLSVPSGQIEPVPDAGPGAFPLDWSADGLRLLVGRRARGMVQLFEWNRLTGAWGRVNPSLSLGEASLGPGPIRLVLLGFGARPQNRSRAPVVIHADRREPRPLPGSAGGRNPDVAGDGTRVVFSKGTGRQSRVLLADLAGGEPRVLARGEQPRFSRDGNWIVYVTRRKGTSDIWLMRSDGSARRPVVTSSFDDDSPALSPDARFVVYASAREREVSQLYMMRLVNGVEVQLTRTGQNGRPVW